MFKKLRIKFIAITMVMVAVVMALAFSVVCIVEYQRSLSVVQTALSDAVNQANDDNQKFKRFDNMNPEFDQQMLENRGVSEASWSRRGSKFDPDNSLNQNAVVSSSSSESQSVSGNSGVAQDANSPQDPNESEDSAAAQGQNASEDSGVAQDQNAAQDQNLPDNQNAPEDPNASTDSESTSASSAAQANDAYNGFAPPEIGNRRNQPRASNSLIPVAVYRTFEQTVTLVPQVTSASISDDVLSEAVESVQGAADGYGTLGDLGLHYYRVTKESATFYAFADTSYTDSWRTLALMLAAVGLATLVVFFVISLFYSRWALKPVREAWDSQRQFVADASHDLKTPLTVVLANSAILLKHPEHSIASESQWIESTQKEAENMQGLVNEMLELAQIEAGEKAPVEKELLDYSDLVDGETLMFDAVALERNCSFECEVEPGITINGNEKQVEKMVSTLVENAFKYVDSGGSVTITLRRSGKNAILRISNTGAIISPEDLPHIFDRFYRTDKARTSGEGGFGLGLAIAREIARQHDGDITCASDQSSGTTFTVTLPIA